MDKKIDYGKILKEKDGYGVNMCPHFDICEKSCMLYQVKTYILNNDELKTEDFTRMQSNWWNHMSADGIRVEPPGLCKSCQQCSCGIDRKSNIEELERHILKSSCMFDPKLNCMKLTYAKNTAIDMRKMVNNEDIAFNSAKRLDGRVLKLEQDSQDSFNKSLNDAFGCKAINLIEDLNAEYPELVTHPKRFLEPNFSFSGKQLSLIHI